MLVVASAVPASHEPGSLIARAHGPAVPETIRIQTIVMNPLYPVRRAICRLFVVAMIVGAVVPRFVLAQSAEDSFNYTVGQTLSAQSGGTGWNGAWSGGAGNTIISGNLVADGVPATGSHVKTPNSGSSASNRTLAIPAGTAGTSLWISCVVQPDNGTSYGGFSVSGGTNSNAGLFVGRSDFPNVSSTWVVENTGGGARVASGVAATTGTPALLVVRLDFGASATTISLFVNPSLDSTPTTPGALKNDTYLGTGIKYLQLTSDGSFEMDEFRVGPTFQSVVTSSAHPTFFNGEAMLSNGVYYLSFPNGNYFGYYSYLADPHYIYHFDLGYEYLFDADDGNGGVYFYDFASSDFFYSSPTFPFPYLYDFNLSSTLYYYPITTSAGHYTTGPRYFYNFSAQQIITK